MVQPSQEKNLFACVVVVTVIDVARALAGVPLLNSFFSHQFENSLADISDRFFLSLSKFTFRVFHLFSPFSHTVAALLIGIIADVCEIH